MAAAEFDLSLVAGDDFRLMQLEYLNTDLPKPVLPIYGDDPRDGTVLRRTAAQLAASKTGHGVRIDRLPGVQAVDGCSLAACVGTADRGVEPLDGSDRAFRCVLRPATWTEVSLLLEPFEKERTTDDARLSDHLQGLTVGARFQYLAETGPVEWIISTERNW